MIVVIQCAKSKQTNAGFLRTPDGKKVLFVNDPRDAPAREGCVHAHPDGTTDTGHTWREKLRAFNQSRGDNPLGLLPAWRLYKDNIYSRLAHEHGVENLYILSAGWGLIAADFLTPCYDITFSRAKNVEPWKRRKADTRYNDFNMLPEESEGPIVFFVSKKYAPLARELTRSHKARKIMYYKSVTEPQASGCEVIKYETRKRTNWHYECAKAFLDGAIGF